MQRRYGFNQQPFRIIKFRTMRALDDGAVVAQATRDDPRLTRIGRWLRRWNIDEIPQLFNVLTGDMSLVGPRPHALSHDHEYERRISLYARRHNVKPGITGWAQINGFRGEIDNDEKIAQARRVRPVLHRQLVALARSEDHRAHGAVARRPTATPIESEVRLSAGQRGDGEDRADGHDRRRQPQHADQQPQRPRLGSGRRLRLGPGFKRRLARRSAAVARSISAMSRAS